MKNLYVVRHGQAEGQAPNAPLTAIGVEQAERLAEFLSDKAIDSILSSPYERACRTIKPLSDKMALPIIVDDRLAERVLSGKNEPDWRERLRQTFDDLDLVYEGGESSHTAMNRAVGVVQEALNGEYNNIVLVSHGNLISLLLKYYDNRFGFREWEALTNPDVFHLAFAIRDKPIIRRIWID